jgi:WD40 repeat protein
MGHTPANSSLGRPQAVGLSLLFQTLVNELGGILFISSKVSQHHGFAKEMCLIVILISLAGCSSPTQTVPQAISETKTKESTIQFTSTPQASPTITPIPKPVQFGTMGRGVMSDVFRSPDGRLIVIGIRDYLHWYDSETFKEMGQLQLGMDGVLNIRFSPDGKLLSVESGSSAQVIDLARQEIVATIRGFESSISDVVIAPDNQNIVFKEGSMQMGDAVGLWNTATGKVEHYFDPSNPDTNHWDSAPAISPDSRLVAAGIDNQVYIWELASGKKRFILNGHNQDINSVGFSPDGKLLASDDQDGIVRLWDVKTGKFIKIISGTDGEVYAVEFSPDGSQLNIESNSTYHWDLETGKLSGPDPESGAPDPFAFQMHLQGYSQNWLPGISGELVFSPDGNSLASGSEPVLIWDMDKLTVTSSLENMHGTFMTDMKYSPDGRWFAATDDRRDLQVWDVQTGQTNIRSENYHGKGGRRAFVFSPSSALLAVANRDEIELWTLDSGGRYSTIPLMSQGNQRVTQLAFSPDENQLHAVLDSNNRQVVAKTWDTATGDLLDQFELAANAPAVFSATGLHWPYFARNSDDGTNSWIEVWDLETKQIISKLLTSDPENEPLRFSPDGRIIVTINNSRLYAWDVATGQQLFTINQVPYNSGIAISPDNKIMAIEQVGTIKLWDISQMTNEK